MTEQRYHAFISYSHADQKAANWLFNRIESYRVPRQLVGQTRGGRTIPTRLTPLFRDREELASSHSLSDSVASALTRSDALIVLCSPTAKCSRWVNEEVRQYKIAGGERRIFPLIVAGDEQTAFPPALRQTFDEKGNPTDLRAEPLAADLDKDGRQNAKLKIIAGLLSVSLDELKQRDLAKRYRRLSYLSGFSLVLLLLLAGLTTWALFAQREADLRRTQADDLIEFMIGDLRKRLEPIGMLDVLDAVGEQAMTYFSTLDPGSETALSTSQRAKAIQQLGEIRLAEGDLERAMPLFRESLRLQHRAYRRAGDPVRFELAQANYWLGYGYWESGDFPGALVYLTEYERHAKVLAASAPDDLVAQLELAYARINLGTVFWEQEDYASALPVFQSSKDSLEALIRAYPDDGTLPATLSVGFGWLAATYWELGRTELARDTFAGQVALSRVLLEADPENFDNKESHVLALQRYGHALAHTGDADSALARQEEALVHAEALSNREANNFFWRYALARSHWYLGEALEMQLRVSDALQSYLRAESVFESLEGAERRPKWLTEHAQLTNDIALLLLRDGDADAAGDWLEKSSALLEASEATRQQAFTTAETALAKLCSAPSAEREALLFDVRNARVVVGVFDATERPELRSIESVLNRALAAIEGQRAPDAEAPVNDEGLDTFEFGKFTQCLRGLGYAPART